MIHEATANSCSSCPSHALNAAGGMPTRSTSSGSWSQTAAAQECRQWTQQNSWLTGSWLTTKKLLAPSPLACPLPPLCIIVNADGRTLLHKPISSSHHERPVNRLLSFPTLQTSPPPPPTHTVSGRVLRCTHLAWRDCLHHDGHEGVVGPTQLRALPVKHTGALDGQPHLRQADKAGGRAGRQAGGVSMCAKIPLPCCSGTK